MLRSERCEPPNERGKPSQVLERQNAPINEAKVTPSDVGTHLLYCAAQAADERLVPGVCLVHLGATKGSQGKECCPLALRYHVVRALCLLLSRLDSLARLRRLNRSYHQLPAQIGVRQNGRHVDTLISRHRFPPIARA